MRAPLLPKLRGYFAEFLREGYLARLGILYQPTCGGLRYGHVLIWYATFFLAAWYQLLTTPSGSPITSHINDRTDFPIQSRYTLGPALPVAG